MMSIKAGRIRERRQQLGLTQEELASQLHVDQKQISKWENGRGNPTARTLIALAQALEVPIDWLVGLTDNPERVVPLAADLDDLEREAIGILRSKPPSRRREIVEILRLMQ
jgi:transcriptional regulator with XRE-family HTH domain